MTVWFLFPDWTQTNTGEEDMYFLLVHVLLTFSSSETQKLLEEGPRFPCRHLFLVCLPALLAETMSKCIF